MSKKTFQIKDHVTSRSKRITGLMQNKYGLGLETFDKALKGDMTSIQLIAQAGITGARIQELAPMLEEAYLTAIKGTEQYNKSKANIIKTAGSSAIAINKSVAQVSLANTKYTHQLRELKEDYVQQKDLEKLRHGYQINYQVLKHNMDKFFMKVDNNTKAIEQTYRPAVAQLAENTRREMVDIKHVLQYGERANLELLPRREYVTTEPTKPQTKISNILDRIRNALGF
jgi:hypothetical protein